MGQEQATMADYAALLSQAIGFLQAMNPELDPADATKQAMEIIERRVSEQSSLEPKPPTPPAP